MDAPSPTARSGWSWLPSSRTGRAWFLRLGLAMVFVLGTLASATITPARGEGEGETNIELEIELGEAGESLTRHRSEVRVSPRGSEHARPLPSRPLAKLRAPTQLGPKAREPEATSWPRPRRRPPPDDDDDAIA
ncbi:hypothetical protein [Paraliomyxa miuraensis]|uniref:hypothetical protein n=1 Tax=Paraliomyxa miuraensis TaxID=376150 RepID=UPI002251B8F0|nr:hypothetical protein [Paraliomyxa miuraensis]MCX4240221.1 hypothetical protein [Paraliomyxa miuraensis]